MKVPSYPAAIIVDLICRYLSFCPSGESANEQESPPQMPHTLNLDLEDREEKAVVPSESDVRDILSSAHALQSHVRIVLPHGVGFVPSLCLAGLVCTLLAL